MKIIAGSNITRMWKEPLSISQEKCVMHYTVFASDHLRKENDSLSLTLIQFVALFRPIIKVALVGRQY
jgi:hypothetical protein